jgi:Alkylmercury lyase
MDEHDLTLRRAIFESFAATGDPGVVDDVEGLRSLAAQHVVVLDGYERVLMAHPFAAHRDGARVESGGREWWGSCAWDAFGIVAALGLRDARVTAQDVTVEVRDGELGGDAVFHVLVPAAHWWDDIGFT